MSSCPKCHTENPAGTEICASCGAGLASPETSDMSDTAEMTSDGVPPAKTRRLNRLAALSFFLGLFSPLSCFLPVITPMAFLLAVIFGAIALAQIGDEQGQYYGRWMAINGITWAIILPALFAIFVFLPRGYQLAHRGNQCTSNQRQIALAINMFCTENEETMPGRADLTPASPDADKQQWRTVDVKEVAAGVFDCKYSRRSGAPGPRTADYAMNADIMGVGLGTIPVPVATLLTVDTKGTDAIFSAKDIDPRHDGGFTASFVDGHVASFTAADVPHDPEANPTGLGAPSINKFLIQGATNVIDVKLVGRKWANPVVYAYTGYEPNPWINGSSDRRDCIKGDYISAFYSQVPPGDVIPKALTIGTFVNGSNSAPSPITLPVPAGDQTAASMMGLYYTFRLPPAVSKPGVYKMTGKNVHSVTIAPVKSGK